MLANNAVARGPVMARDGKIGELDLDVLELGLAVNLRAVALAIKFALPHLVARGGGSIVNTTSAVAHLPEGTRTVYAATKAAVESLTRSTAAQYGKLGIRCNAVAPGVTLSSSLLHRADPAFLARHERHHLTARLGQSADVAAAILYLASDESAFVTGHVLAVDGGLTAHHPGLADEWAGLH